MSETKSYHQYVCKRNEYLRNIFLEESLKIGDKTIIEDEEWEIAHIGMNYLEQPYKVACEAYGNRNYSDKYLNMEVLSREQIKDGKAYHMYCQYHTGHWEEVWYEDNKWFQKIWTKDKQLLVDRSFQRHSFEPQFGIDVADDSDLNEVLCKIVEEDRKKENIPWSKRL